MRWPGGPTRDTDRDRDRAVRPVASPYVTAMGTDVPLLACERIGCTEETVAEARFRFLATALQALSASDDYATTIAAVARLAVPRIADWASVHVIDDTGHIRRVAVVHHDPGRRHLTDELIDRFPLDLTGPQGAPAALRTGRPTLATTMDDEFLAAHVRDRRQRQIYRELGSTSGIAAPLIIGERVVGVLTLLLGDSGRSYEDADIELAEDLARLCGIAVDNAMRRRAADAALDQMSERARRLAEVAELGQRAITTDDVRDLEDEAVHRVAGTLGVSHVAIVELTADRSAFHTVAGVGWDPTVYRGLVPAGRESLAGYTLAVDDSVVARDLSFETRFTVPAPLREHGIVSAATVVLWGPLEPVGVLGVYSNQRRDFTGDDLAYLRSVANVVGAAMSRSHSETALRAEQARAQAAQERLAFLADASAALTESLDSRATLEKVAFLAVPRLADWCSVEVHLDPAAPERVVAHVDPAKVALAEELNRRYPPDPDAATGAPYTLRTGESQLWPEIPESLVVETARDPEHAQVLMDLGLRSAMVVPLIARGRVIGAMTLVAAESARNYDDLDLALGEDLGRRAAVAIENARLYEEHERVATTLQASLLPPTNPVIPGLEVATAYRAAGGIPIGGDFFDVFETVDGWAVAVGDVCGKGTEAAWITGLARHTLRAAAVRDVEPHRVLAVMNDAMLGQVPEFRFCTMVTARVEMPTVVVPAPASGAVRLTVATAGHPAPMILRASGAVEVVNVSGTMLGMFESLTFPSQTVELLGGDTIVFFTDGAVEARSGDAVLGEDGLATLLAGLAGATAAEVVDALDRAVLDFQHGVRHDDLALVAIRVPPA